ncbi:MAG: endoribonuclease [Devosia sp.]|uniref:RidA family protein n=1 Tax=Devosia sp. TaxID=1871048 RepID=UPI00261B6474|nr:RidA family protein [Devosia sp.]MDB5531108.1 endoribonuclease [Devosia sp.]
MALAQGLVLPAPPKPAGAYRPAVIVGDLIYLSGFGARNAEGGPLVGIVGRDFDVAAANAAARGVGLSILSVLQDTLGDLEQVQQVIRITGMICAVPEFAQHPAVIDGCSTLLLEVFGERGAHARMAYGVASLPGGTALAIDCICQIRR